MQRIIKAKPVDLLHMDPFELSEYLRNIVDLSLPESIDTKESAKSAICIMNKAVAYACFFKEMESLAKTYKRKMKREGCTAEVADNLLGCEEVFEAYKRISERHYDYVAKMMTLKRLQIEETKMLGTST